MTTALNNLRTWLGMKEDDIEPAPALPAPEDQPAMTLSDSGRVQSNLTLGLAQVRQVLEGRLREHFGKGSFKMPDMQLYDDNSVLFNKLGEWGLTVEEYLMLMIALAPHLHPNFFDSIIQQFVPKDGEFPEFGGMKGVAYRGMLPTGDTLLFMLGGPDLPTRMAARQHILDRENILFKEQVLTLEEPPIGEPDTSGRLLVSRDYIELFTTGQKWRPRFGPGFPAQLITTEMEWPELVLSDTLRGELDQIYNWLMFNEKLMQDPALHARLKAGYRALFYGPPGTGKTLAATLLGKRLGLDVYRIDLSQVVSKYIGETEKNLQTLFEMAANKQWILFFDEADALFGKRTAVNSSHDRYANQEVSYLLQRIEDYNGLVILASNFRNNMDIAFTRRFQAMVNFVMPTAAERVLLWRQTLPTTIETSPDLSVEELATHFELTGASILNIVQLATIQALANAQPLSKQLLVQEIRKEYAKEGRTM
ncbi:ATP-binding protein [Dyadobacter sp. CY261]|uniref:ATP-binding protein n=1 Tax=Dyadobacter sp. CY261 TaxID=2907203 RepID=UPI001F37DE3A|nr:ATP-binding protein [Dyadobacter sp. CY261]MCF0074350.1 ATP-binding protein [Dyadobacter sp. CY261]